MNYVWIILLILIITITLLLWKRLQSLPHFPTITVETITKALKDMVEQSLLSRFGSTIRFKTNYGDCGSEEIVVHSKSLWLTIDDLIIMGQQRPNLYNRLLKCGALQTIVTLLLLQWWFVTYSTNDLNRFKMWTDKLASGPGLVTTTSLKDIKKLMVTDNQP